MTGFNLSAWAVAHRSLVGFLIALIFAAGALSYSHLGRNEDPSFTVKLMVVTAEWPGATARETQDLLAEPIERKLQDLAHLDHLTTFSRPGFTAIMVSFRDDTAPSEVPELFYQARKKLDDLRPSLPAGVIGPAADDEYTDVYGAVFALTGANNAELVRQAERVRDRFLRLPGAEKVTILGEIPRTVDVEFSHSRLAALGVTVPEIARAIAAQNGVTDAGLVETHTTRVPLRVDGALDGPASLGAVPVPAGNTTLRLSDIATIHRGYQDPPQFSVRHNGAPAVVLALSTQKGTNGLAFGDALRAEAERIRASLPAGITLEQIADQPQVIGEAVGEFQLKFAVALGVVLVVSFLSLGWRTGIVVALAVPLTLALVFVVMDLMGIELQRVSLGALIISLGLLVDDAIIAVEMMVVKLEEGWDRVRAATFAWTSTAFPMLTGTLVTAAGFLPVGLARSTTGEYAGGIFWVVTIALLVSWVVAVIFTPYLGVLLLPAPKHVRSHDAVYGTRPYRMLRAVVAFCVRWRRSVVLATVALFLLSVGGMGLVRQQFFPSSARPELIVDITLRQGASHQATEAAVKKVEAALAGDRDVRWYTSYVGAGPPRFFLAYNPPLPNDAIATIVLTTRDAEARERVRARLMAFAAGEGAPEARVRVSRLELGPPVGFPVQFRVVGTDLGAVRRAADQVLQTLRSTPGTRDAQLAWGERAPSVRLELDQARVRQLGLSPEDVAQTLATLVSGVTATEIRDRTKRVGVVLRAVPAERLDLDQPARSRRADRRRAAAALPGRAPEAADGGADPVAARPRELPHRAGRRAGRVAGAGRDRSGAAGDPRARPAAWRARRGGRGGGRVRQGEQGAGRGVSDHGRGDAAAAHDPVAEPAAHAAGARHHAARRHRRGRRLAGRGCAVRVRGPARRHRAGRDDHAQHDHPRRSGAAGSGGGARRCATRSWRARCGAPARWC